MLNNHGSCYLLQKIAFESFLDQKEELFESYLSTNILIFNSINESGEQIYELNRSLPNHYCCFNLQQLLNINSIIIKESNLNLFGHNEKKIS